MERVGGRELQRYSAERPRSLIGMVGRRAFRRVNGAATALLVIPLVVMAARVLGPGPARLRLVKLAHNLEPRYVVDQPEELFGGAPEPAVQPDKRAA